MRSHGYVNTDSMRTALIVEDSDGVRAAAAEIARKAGWVVFETADPNKALLICKTIRFDKVLTDYTMPGMNGKELANRLHDEIPNGYRPKDINMMTGESPWEVNMKTVGPNISAMVQKPFTDESLSALFV